MPGKVDEKVIGGFRYRMEQVGMETGEQIVLRLSRPVAALFSRAASKGVNGVSLQQLVLTGLGPALGALSGRDLRYVRKKLAEKTVVWLPDGAKVREWPLKDYYDEHFAGRYTDALQWFKWGLQLNRFFGDALDRLDDMLAARAKATEEAAAAAASRSSSPTDSRGGSTGSSSPSTAAPT